MISHSIGAVVLGPLRALVACSMAENVGIHAVFMRAWVRSAPFLSIIETEAFCLSEQKQEKRP